MVLLVVTGAVISAVGWYEPFLEFAGAGAGVPLLGFGNVLMKGVKEAIQEKGFLGLFTRWFSGRSGRNLRRADFRISGKLCV